MFVDCAAGHRRLRSLRDVAPARACPRLSIITAARNEARRIEVALTSLLRLDYPALEIIAVNDRSTDETGAILERLARQHARLTIKHISELPEGWLGKNYALHVGAAEASGTLLLFTDADVVFEPTTLRRAAALMELDALDHLAAIPDVKVPGIALNAFVAAFGVFFSLYARPWKARDARSRFHIGIGAFNLVVVRQFFMSLPPELLESARIDGANDLWILWRIVLPLSKPVLAVIALFYGVGYWNEFFTAILYLNEADKWPIQLVLRQYVLQGSALLAGGVTPDPSQPPPPAQTIQMAVVVIATVPILMVYPFLQRYFTKGVLAGAIKG